VKGAGRFGSVRALAVCTAGDVLGDWQSFRLREASMLEAGSGGVCALRDALRRRWVLLEVRDECSSSDSAGGVGYGFAFS
jgi:hypothetical protein